MKILILSVGILLLVFVNTLADQTITCKMLDNDPTSCLISGETIGQNEAVSIKTDPENVDVSKITWLKFSSSSIYSIPPEVFTTFPSIKWFFASGQNILEVKRGTFWDGKNLEWIHLGNNNVTFLDRRTFNGENFQSEVFNQNSNL
jgi:hypothetical protein